MLDLKILFRKKNIFIHLLFFYIVIVQTAYGKSAPSVGKTLTGILCPQLKQGFGPFDYSLRSHLKKELNLVESAHFTPEVESLVRGNTSVTPAQDLQYTIRAWPNHHRALYSILRYQLLNKGKRVLNVPVECYFQRAIAFSPKDPITHMLFGMYLHRSNKLELAIKYYTKAEKLQPKRSEIIYNFGLLLFDMKNYKLAKSYAKRAEALGYPLKGLQRKLKKIGY